MSIRGFNVGGVTQQYDYNYLDNKPTIPTASGNWTSTAIQLLNTILTAGVYTSDQSANIAALIAEISGSSAGIEISYSGTTATVSGLAGTSISYSGTTATIGG